jgi:hypothetical protein
MVGLNQFIEGVAVQRRIEALVDKADELLLGRLPLIALKEGEPLRCFTGHVEGGEEHLARIRHFLNAEELIAAIQPWKRVFSAIIRGEEELVPMLGSVRDGVGVVSRCRFAVVRIRS